MINIDQVTGDIVVSGFEQGIGASPYTGISDMRNVNIDSVPGEVHVNFATINNTPAAFTFNITAASGTTITYSSTQGTPYYGQCVYLTGASLPGGLTAGAADVGPFYWVANVDPVGKTLELYAKPFFIAYNISAVSTSSTGTATANPISMGTPKYRTYSLISSSSSLANYFLIDSNGRAWSRTDGATANWLFLGNKQSDGGVGGAYGNGIVWYQGYNPAVIFNTGAYGYLFVFRNTKIDYMEILGGNWTYGWKSLNTTYTTQEFDHYALVGTDNAVYYCDTSSVGSIIQTNPATTFDPTNAATYTFSNYALNLPTQDTAIFLEELGQQLLVSGIKDYIYPWDRVSTSYDLPIRVGEPNVSRMVTINAKTYLFAGNRGRIYVTNGSQADLFYKIPDHLSGTVSPYIQWGAWGSTRNQLYFGMQGYKNDGSVVNGYGGLWKLNVDNGTLTCSNTLSYDTGSHSGYASLFIPWPIIGNEINPGGAFMVGWADNYTTPTSQGMDASTTNPYTDGSAYVISDLMPIGTKLKPTTIEQIEYKLATPLKTGESVKILAASFFSTTPSDYTSAGTTAGSSASTIISDIFSTPVQVNQWLAVKAVLTGIVDASGPSYNRMTEMRIHKGTQKITSWRQLQ
ncbi:MAG: hypothetical protein KGI72_05380 [Patescibacteria group bacterium]|nr:hypothetical protein [Patescibacteria group bacterium]MDE2233092.1 hypothetical protein [Patescibacteria group bacterium]